MDPEKNKRHDVNRQRRKKRRRKERFAALCVFSLVILLFLGIAGYFGYRIYRHELEENRELEELAKEQAEPEEVQVLSEPEEIISENKVKETVSANTVEDLEEQLYAQIYEQQAEEAMAKMSMHEKLCQLFFVTPEALTGADVVTQCGPTSEKAYEEYPVGGIIYFAQNMTDREQTKQMLSGMQSAAVDASKIPVFLGVDEEGGKVARVADTLGTTTFSPMFEYKDLGEDIARENAKTIGSDISALGFNVDFAPVADVWVNPDNQVIGSRAYGDDYEEVAKLVSAAVEGFAQSGVLCVAKHFPGHGNTAQDSHTTLATTDRSLSQLREAEYLPFQAAIRAGVPFVMSGHVTVTGAEEKPATLSSLFLTDELRNTLGFEGVIITDAMNMQAITDYYGTNEACVQAFRAGADMILMPVDFKGALAAFEKEVEENRISQDRIDESVKRILVCKFRYLS